jgi:hypothetical protein
MQTLNIARFEIKAFNKIWYGEYVKQGNYSFTSKNKSLNKILLREK